VMRPIALPACSVNQRAPSGPAAIHRGWLPGAKRYSVIAPTIVMRPILEPFHSVNQSAPIGSHGYPAGLAVRGRHGVFVEGAGRCNSPDLAVPTALGFDKPQSAVRPCRDGL
jgi:hypothetical protein